MRTHHLTLKATALAAALLASSPPVLATNGMNMEGYGPISTAMGGASQAIDHGTAALAQNPATLALMGSNSRLDIALGRLGPKVKSRMTGMPTAESDGTSYVMPALGYARKAGALTYGFGIFAQGGMGTEYSANTFLAMGSGAPVRSELGVGRAIFPLALQVNNDLAVGATLDFMWAGLDLRMAASGAQLGQLVTSASGNLGQALPNLAGAPWARIDFSNGSDFTGQATATGWAGKLGAVYKAAPGMTLGASYQTKSRLGDMKTSNSGASLSATGGFTDSGKMTVIDFQWPATWALGAAWQATPQLLLAADVKRIEWSGVMKSFNMRYDSSGMGGSVSFALPQDWRDQTAVSLGAAWRVNDMFTARAGFNRGSNPIPNALVNPLFPATVESHYTLGAGVAFSPVSELNVSLTVAPESKITNASGITVTHSQTNAQLMYTHRF